MTRYEVVFTPEAEEQLAELYRLTTKAVEATFKNRETEIPTDDFEVITTAFAECHLVQWNAFMSGSAEIALAIGATRSARALPIHLDCLPA